MILNRKEFFMFWLNKVRTCKELLVYQSKETNNRPHSHSHLQPLVLQVPSECIATNFQPLSHTDLKLVLQLSSVFHHDEWTFSEDVCDLLSGEQAPLPEEQHHVFNCLYRHRQDLGVKGHHSLKTS